MASILPSLSFCCIKRLVTRISQTEVAFSRLQFVRKLFVVGSIQPRECDSRELARTGDDPLYFEKCEDDYLFRYYKQRLELYDKIADESENEQVNEILANLEGKNLKSLEQGDLSGIISSLRRLNHSSLNILLRHCLNTGVDLPRTLRYQLDDCLKYHLLRTKLNSSNCDSWFYSANLVYQSAINSLLIARLIAQLSTPSDLLLSDKQFLHLLFLTIIKRKHYGILSNQSRRILRMLDTTTFIETVTISSAFFKTKSRIQDSLMIKKIVNSTLKSRHLIKYEEPGFCSIVKAIRYSREYDCRKSVLTLLDNLFQEENPRQILMSKFNMVHVLKLAEVYRIYKEGLLSEVFSTMMSNLNSYRIKDIQYILSSLSNFAYHDEKLNDNLDQLVKSIITETRFDAHMQEQHLMPLLRSFAIFNYYNDELMDYINRKMQNDPEAVKKMKNVIEFNRSVLLFYVASRIEGKSVHFSPGSSLLREVSSSINRSIGNSGSLKPSSSLGYLNFLLKSSQTNLEMNNIYRDIAVSLTKTSQLGGSNYHFYFQHTLPHQNYTDLVISKDGEEVGSFDEKSYMPRMAPDNRRHVIVLAFQKFDLVDADTRLSGYRQLIMRLLAKLRYHVIPVNVDDYNIDVLATRIKSTLDGEAPDGS